MPHIRCHGKKAADFVLFHRETGSRGPNGQPIFDKYTKELMNKQWEQILLPAKELPEKISPLPDSPHKSSTLSKRKTLAPPAAAPPKKRAKAQEVEDDLELSWSSIKDIHLDDDVRELASQPDAFLKGIFFGAPTRLSLSSDSGSSIAPKVKSVVVNCTEEKKCGEVRSSFDFKNLQELEEQKKKEKKTRNTGNSINRESENVKTGEKKKAPASEKDTDKNVGNSNTRQESEKKKHTVDKKKCKMSGGRDEGECKNEKQKKEKDNEKHSVKPRDRDSGKVEKDSETPRDRDSGKE